MHKRADDMHKLAEVLLGSQEQLLKSELDDFPDSKRFSTLGSVSKSSIRNIWIHWRRNERVDSGSGE
jgi:hypothetical protein